jgi:threonine dehydrogenase-like Zn-dependent dehydrogenase
MCSEIPIAEQRMVELAAKEVVKAHDIIIYGLGLGFILQHVLDVFPKANITVLEPSASLLEWARAGCLNQWVVDLMRNPRVNIVSELDDQSTFDLAFLKTNAVCDCAAQIKKVLRPGGVFALASNQQNEQLPFPRITTRRLNIKSHLNYSSVYTHVVYVCSH